MISSLEEISIHGIWGPVTEVKHGLALGLQGKYLISSLKKLSLDLESQESFKIEDFERLCDAIFSLPQLDNLDLVLGEGFLRMMEQYYYKDVMYKSWCDKGAGVQLKLIHFHSDMEPDHLGKKLRVGSMTQNISSTHMDNRSVLYRHPDYYHSADDYTSLVA